MSATPMKSTTRARQATEPSPPHASEPYEWRCDLSRSEVMMKPTVG